jgi:hypothetical protein
MTCEEIDRAVKNTGRCIRVRRASAASTSPSMLEALAKDESYEVREAVAANPSTPLKSLDALAKDVSCGIRQTIAANASTPSRALEALAKTSLIFDLINASSR